jgi:hypothetical protein
MSPRHPAPPVRISAFAYKALSEYVDVAETLGKSWFSIPTSPERARLVYELCNKKHVLDKRKSGKNAEFRLAIPFNQIEKSEKKSPFTKKHSGKRLKQESLKFENSDTQTVPKFPKFRPIVWNKLQDYVTAVELAKQEIAESKNVTLELEIHQLAERMPRLVGDDLFRASEALHSKLRAQKEIAAHAYLEAMRLVEARKEFTGIPWAEIISHDLEDYRNMSLPLLEGTSKND